MGERAENMAGEDPEHVISILLETYRNRELPAGGLSCSQAVVCSQANSWIHNCMEQVTDPEQLDLRCLIEKVPACDVLDLLKALQAVCRSPGKWFELSKSCISDPTMTEGRKGKDVIEFVLNQIDQMEGEACVELIETLLDSIGPSSNENHEKCLDLLPKLLSKVSRMEHVVAKRARQLGESRTSQFSGEGYRAAIIEELCRLEWPKPFVVPICTVLRDLHLTEEQLKRAISRVAKEAYAIELQGLPPLVYQLLLLTAHGHRTHILRLILAFFGDLDARCPISDAVRMSQDEITESGSVVEEGELVQVEGIVIMHFVFAVKQDLALGQELLRVLKVRVCDLTPFETALLLSLSRIQRYESKAMEILRKAAEQNFAHECKMTSSSWISSLQEMKPPSDFKVVMRHVLRRSTRGWDQVVPGIVSILFHILEINARKCPAVDRQIVGQQAAASFSKTVAGNAVSKCIGLIELAFKHQESVREDVLGQIFSRVLTRDESVPCFIRLLHSITRRSTRDVLGYLPKVKEALEYVGYMTPHSAVALVRALEPILRLQPSLHDYLMIILRKSLFSREAESRMVALDTLLHLAVVSSRASASYSASQSLSQNPGGPTEDVGLEIVGQLRRCLGQQASIRQKLYDGFCDVVVAKPELLEYTTNILILQLQRFCQVTQESRVLTLEKCLDEGKHIAEPVAHLLHAITQCIMTHASIHGDQMAGVAENDVMAAAREQMSKLLAWISCSELEDFDLDPKTPFSMDGDEGRKHLNIAKLLFGVKESLLEFDLMCTSVSDSSFEKSLALVKKMQELATLMRDTKGAKGKKVASNTDDKSTLLSWHFTERMLSMTGGDCPDSPYPASVQEAMCRSADFMALAIQTAARQIAQLKVGELGPEHRKAAFGACCMRIAPLLVKQFFVQWRSREALPMPLPTSVNAKKSILGPPKLLALVALQALGSCVQCACGNFKADDVGRMAKELVRQLRAQDMRMGDVATGSGAEGYISECIQLLQCLFETMLAEEDDSSMAGVVMDIATTLGSVLSCRSLEIHADWTKKACMENGGDVEAGNPSLIKALVGSYLHMMGGSNELAEVAGIADDVLSMSRELEEGEEEGAEGAVIPNYKIVGDENVTAIIACLVDFLKGSCDEVEWVLGYLDASARPDVHDNDDESDLPENVAAVQASNKVEDEALGRLTRLVDVSLTLAKCVRIEQTSIECIIGGLARVYRSAEFTARRLLIHKGKIRKPFVNLMHKIGGVLNEAMYELLMRYAMAEAKDSNRQKISKEQKLLPNLIYHVERLEADLIKIQKEPENKHKVDFMKNFKRSQARDFKIKAKKLEEALSKEDEDKENKGKGKKRGKGKGKKGKGDGDAEEEENHSQAPSDPSQRSAKRVRA